MHTSQHQPSISTESHTKTWTCGVKWSVCPTFLFLSMACQIQIQSLGQKGKEGNMATTTQPPPLPCDSTRHHNNCHCHCHVARLHDHGHNHNHDHNCDKITTQQR